MNYNRRAKVRQKNDAANFKFYITAKSAKERGTNNLVI